MLGRHIAKVMRVQGADYPFRTIASTLQSADIVFGNLESVVADDSASAYYPEKPYSFHGSAQAIPALKRAGFNVVTLANNHAMDYGPDALAETRRLLQQNGLEVFGAGKEIADARRPLIVTRKGVTFGFLGYGVAHSRKVYAGKNKPGIAPIIMDNIHADIAVLRGKVDVLVLSLHWGIEYDSQPSRLQQDEAHQLIDWGADMIIGHHPHVMQGVEVYKGKIIAYSLGNFVFDQKGKGTDRSFMLACTFRGKTLSAIEIVPLDRIRTYFPRVATGTVKTAMLKELDRISLPMNAKIPKLFRAGFVEMKDHVTP